MIDEDALRRILNAEAERTEVAPDALEAIRARIARRRARRWLGWLPRGFALVGFTGGTALVAAALVGLALFGVPRFGPAPVGPGASSSQNQTGPQTVNLPIYYIGATSTGPRLYREYHQLVLTDADPAAKAEAAVRAMLAEHGASDPDYTSPWPAGVTVNATRVDGDTVTVDLGNLASDPGGADPATVRMSLEQLVWTATAASGTMRARLLVDGQGVTTFRGVPGGGGVLGRGAAVDVLAPVWVIDPQQGAPVGHVVKVRLAGSVFEGRVQLRVRTAAGAVVKEQPVQLSAGAPDRGEGTATVTLSSGAYTVEAYVVSPRDGGEQFLDGHQITVP